MEFVVVTILLDIDPNQAVLGMLCTVYQGIREPLNTLYQIRKSIILSKVILIVTRSVPQVCLMVQQQKCTSETLPTWIPRKLELKISSNSTPSLLYIKTTAYLRIINVFMYIFLNSKENAGFNNKFLYIISLTHNYSNILPFPNILS